MATNNLSFAAQIDDWTKATEARMAAVFKTSVEDICDVMQKTAPVDTGFLKSSFQVLINAPLPLADKPQSSVSALPSYSATIAGAKLTDYVSAGYSALYGPRLEYGFVGTDKLGRVINQPPRAWVRGAIAQWPQIVSANVAKAKDAVKANTR